LLRVRLLGELEALGRLLLIAALLGHSSERAPRPSGELALTEFL
jgi:hypothetical protein